MGLFDLIRKNLKPVVENKWKRTVAVKTISGKKNILSQTEDNRIILNYDKEIIIVNIDVNTSTVTKKSAGKKLLGGATGALIAGPAGGVIGALAVGNNKVKTVNDIIYLHYTDTTKKNNVIALRYDEATYKTLGEIINDVYG